MDLSQTSCKRHNGIEIEIATNRNVLTLDYEICKSIYPGVWKSPACVLSAGALCSYCDYDRVYSENSEILLILSVCTPSSLLSHNGSTGGVLSARQHSHHVYIYSVFSLRVLPAHASVPSGCFNLVTMFTLRSCFTRFSLGSALYNHIIDTKRKGEKKSTC